MHKRLAVARQRQLYVAKTVITGPQATWRVVARRAKPEAPRSGIAGTRGGLHSFTDAAKPGPSAKLMV